MKVTRNIFAVLATAGLLFTAGCKKSVFDINSNPDAVTDASVTPSVLLPGALQNTSRIVATDWSFLNAWMGHWARNGSYQSLTDEETYRFTNNFQVQIWNDLYSNNTNYDIMVNKANALGAGFYEAIGRIMKAHNFGILVDVYGNVPYSEAFKGTATPTPKYDKAADIYKSLFGELDAAITLLRSDAATETAKNPDIGTADLVYAGNRASWIRFAHTLRLRLLMHLHNGLATPQVVSGFDIPGQVAKFTGPTGPTSFEGFIGAGQSAHLNPGFSATKPQPYYRAYVQNESGTQTGDVWRASKYSIDYYKFNVDARIDRFYTSPNGTTAGQMGIIFGTPSGTGVPTGTQLSTVRGIGMVPNGAASRAWILTSVESLFLQAEARERGLITTGTTETLLNAAITESFVWLGVGGSISTSGVLTPNDAAARAAAATYIANNSGYPDVDPTPPFLTPAPPGGALWTIMSQKWFGLNAIAEFEIWSDYRRTDYVLGSVVGYLPGPPLSVDPGRTATSIPRRLLYPQAEYSYNAANVGAEGTLNVFNNKIFWDLN